ncbi:MAG TPA: CbiX/SirB N-terminal domain-containing protein [Gemmatimonadota bacterium]
MASGPVPALAIVPGPTGWTLGAAVLALGLPLLAAVSAPAQVVERTAAAAERPDAGPATVGTVLLAHGGGPEWNAQVEAVARAARTGGPVQAAFLMGPGAAARPFQDVVAGLASAGVREVVVVPLLVSSHSGHFEQARWLTGGTDSLDAAMRHHLEMGGLGRPPAGIRLRLAPALDDALEMAHVLADRALALAEDAPREALFLVGHGPNSAEDHAAWMANLRRVAGEVRARTGFRDVKVGLVRDDGPAPVRAEAVAAIRETIELQHELTGRDVVVVPILIAEGEISRRKLPADLEGLPIRYDGRALLPHDGVARWVEARVSEAAAGVAERAGREADAGPEAGGGP